MNLDPDWPQIDGIDSAEAQLRYGRHPALFRSTLARLLEQAPSLNEPLESPERAADSVHHLHRLSGTAATLGARGLHAQAKALELQLLAGDWPAARAALPTLQQGFAALQRASAAYLQPAAPTPSSDPLPWPAQQLSELCELLRQRKLRASALFEQISPALRSRLGEADFAALQADLLALRHADALARLIRLQPGPSQEDQREPH
ncbi:HPt (histidine-containing phosphotransfer) domain-containing protein [Inhella inkyongensis]|uniref:HPt (Histidine-containing phosphotransfer) domain-containing protein n=1 Tax=Inhella inkyongensis TaxID=392593 RepID=A0A840S3P9_9BURK|nr:Hpt domain-containing protein [Inhella inkyongensis]MBB5204975.1 HPt (histidine-containing phosphotransfer) domain-containing protein [Inhella inkyongensis]